MGCCDEPNPPGSTPAPHTPPAPTLPCTTADLEIVNVDTGAVVSGTTMTKIVGQKINLLVRTRPTGHSLTNPHWAIPDRNVKEYPRAKPAGTPTPLAAADLTGTTISFYFINAGSKAVTVQADVDGCPKSSSVTINVL